MLWSDDDSSLFLPRSRKTYLHPSKDGKITVIFWCLTLCFVFLSTGYPTLSVLTKLLPFLSWEWFEKLLLKIIFANKNKLNINVSQFPELSQDIVGLSHAINEVMEAVSKAAILEKQDNPTD